MPGPVTGTYARGAGENRSRRSETMTTVNHGRSRMRRHPSAATPRSRIGQPRWRRWSITGSAVAWYSQGARRQQAVRRRRVVEQVAGVRGSLRRRRSPQQGTPTG